MNLSTIFLIVAIIILLYIIINYIFADVNTLSNLISGTSMVTINANTLAQSPSGTSSSNFAYSIWFYVNDWNYRYGEPKVIYARMGSPSISGSGSGSNAVTAIIDMQPCPAVFLDPISNNLNVALSVWPGIATDTSTEGTTATTHLCTVPNVPIQKWVNLLISVYGRSLDIYLDGKLVKTCVLPGVANINYNSNVYVTPNGGFSGWTSKFQYYPNSIDPQTAWNIYQQGYGANWLSNIFGKYQIKFSFVNGGTEQSSITI